MIKSGTASLPEVLPGDSCFIDLPCEVPEGEPKVDGSQGLYHLNVSLKLKQATNWATYASVIQAES